MKYDEFHKLIEEPNTEKKQALFKKAMEGLSLPVELQCGAQSTTAEKIVAQNPKSKRRNSFKNFFKKPARLAACVSLATAVVCLAIILPFTLNNDGGLQATTPSTSDNPSTTNDRFCAAATCKEIELNYSLKEYFARNNLSLLYVDWYAKAEIQTTLHADKNNKTDIVYYEEISKHKGTGSIVELYITDYRTRVDKVVNYQIGWNNLYVSRNSLVRVYWHSETVEDGGYSIYTAFFLYMGYEYTLVMRYPMDENSIFEVIDSMLPVFKR